MRVPIVSLLFLLAAIAGHAQFPTWPRAICAVNIVDEKGRSLLPSWPDSLRLKSLPELRSNDYPPSSDLLDLREVDQKGRMYLKDYVGKPATVPPALSRYFLFIGGIKDIIAIRENGDDFDTMRIVLLNYRSRTDSSRYTTYLIDNITFRKGTYELDCNRIAATRDINYKGLLRLRLFTIRAKPTPRMPIVISRQTFLSYRLGDYALHPDGTFDYEHIGTDLGAYNVHGRGVYRLRPRSVTFTFRYFPLGKDTSWRLVGPDSTGYMLDVTTRDDKGDLVPFATFQFKGAKDAFQSDANGQGRFRLRNRRSPLIVTVSAVGHSPLEIRLPGPGHYRLRCVMDRYNAYIKEGTVERAAFTDLEKDFIGLYWLSDGETFDFNKQRMMDDRRFYLNKRYRFYGPIVVVQ